MKRYSDEMWEICEQKDRMIAEWMRTCEDLVSALKAYAVDDFQDDGMVARQAITNYEDFKRQKL